MTCFANQKITRTLCTGNGNRKAKFCTVLDSGCLQCTGIERTDDYIAQLKADPSKKKSNKAHKDLIPMSFLICNSQKGVSYEKLHGFNR